MPNISMTTPETSQSVSRPIILDIISQVQDITKIPKETKVFFPGDIQLMSQPGSTIDNTDRDSEFLSQRVIQIEVEEEHDIDELSSTAVAQREHLPVFLDTVLDVAIKPVYSKTSVTVNFIYRTPSKTEALRWRDDIRMKVSQLRDINLHNIHYHYALPRAYLVLLKEIHRLRENVAGYGQSFSEYFISNASDRITELGNLTGTESEIGVSETQGRIVGIFGFEGVPEKPEKDSDNRTWTTRFTYKFTYDKPIACNMKYPIMVHNQLLSPDYVISEAYNPDQKVMTGSVSFTALNYFESQEQLSYALNTKPVIAIPEHDDYIPTTIPVGTASIFFALCELDLEERYNLLNLKELGDIAIDEDILDFILKSEYPYITRLYKSVLHLSLYRNQNLLQHTALDLDSQLNLTTKSPLDLRDQHRVRLSLVTDLTFLDKDALDRLRRYPKAMTKIIIAMNEALRDFPYLEKLGDKRYITLEDFDPVFRFFTGVGFRNNDSVYGSGKASDSLNPASWSIYKEIQAYAMQRYQFNTVMATSVMALNRG